MGVRSPAFLHRGHRSTGTEGDGFIPDLLRIYFTYEVEFDELWVIQSLKMLFLSVFFFSLLHERD